MSLKKLYYVLTTLKVEIEKTPNSRPMTYLSDEHNDQAITPISFTLWKKHIKTKLSAH